LLTKLLLLYDIYNLNDFQIYDIFKLFFAALKLGLPMPPPYLGVSTTERYQIASGINYASGSCGILNTTRNVKKFFTLLYCSI